MPMNRNQIKLLAVVGGSLFLVLVLFLLARASTPKPPGSSAKPVTLVVWGTGLTTEQLQPLFDDFEARYAKTYSQELTIQYQSWAPSEYEQVLVNKIAEQKGPDVALVEGTWLPKHYPKFQSFPEEFGGGFIKRTNERDIGIMTPAAFDDTFVQAASDAFVASDRVFAVPLFVDTLGLYYNEDQYRSGGIPNSRPATTWQEFDAKLPKLVGKAFTAPGAFTRSGIALGDIASIRVLPQGDGPSTPALWNNGADVLQLFFVQRGVSYCEDFCTKVSFTQKARTVIEDYLRYTDPESATYTWSAKAPELFRVQYVDDSVDAFLLGKVSTIVGYARLYAELGPGAERQKLPLKVAPIPQWADADGNVEQRIALASVWGAAAVATSKNGQAALEFVNYLGRRDPQWTLFLATKIPPAREDLLESASRELPALEPFIRQAQYAEILPVYDRQILVSALTEAFRASSGSLSTASQQIFDALARTLEQMASDPARNPPPEAPKKPAGAA